MKLQTTQSLFNYWNTLRAGRSAPERREIDPTSIRQLLANTFIIEITPDNEYNFRLAGSNVCAAYCRELKNVNFMDFWQGEDHDAVRTMISAVTEDAAVSLITLEGSNNRQWNETFELLMMPLQHNGEGYTRILGTFTAYDTPYWYGMYPITKHKVVGLKLIWPDDLNKEFVSIDSTDEPAYPLSQTATFGRKHDNFTGIMRPTQYAHLSIIDGGKT